MSGHSKWHSIREKKGVADKKRAKLFTQMARAVTVAARKGGGDPRFNFSLRLAIDRAKAANVPKDNIDRAIKRGTGEIEGAEITEKRYEGYGPDGVAVIVDALTDNSNRTVAELKHLFSKNGGNLEGSVAWQFEQKGVIVAPGKSPQAQDEEWQLQAIDHGIDDIQTEEEDLILLTEPTKLQDAKVWLEGQFGEETELVAELQMVPKERLPLDAEAKERVNKLLDAVEEHDDVERVFHNAEL